MIICDTKNRILFHICILCIFSARNKDTRAQNYSIMSEVPLRRSLRLQEKQTVISPKPFISDHAPVGAVLQGQLKIRYPLSTTTTVPGT